MFVHAEFFKAQTLDLRWIVFVKFHIPLDFRWTVSVFLLPAVCLVSVSFNMLGAYFSYEKSDILPVPEEIVCGCLRAFVCACTYILRACALDSRNHCGFFRLGRLFGV